MTHVHFDYIDSAGKKHKNSDICFRSVNFKSDQTLEYKCKIDKRLTEEEIQFFIEFVRGILDEKLFSERLEDRIWYFSLRPCDFICAKLCLLYLTCARLPDEFPEIIKYTFANKGTTLEETFQVFQKAHKVELSYKTGNSGHAIIPLGIYSSGNNITLEKFKQNMTEARPTVYNYFEEKNKSPFFS